MCYAVFHSKDLAAFFDSLYEYTSERGWDWIKQLFPGSGPALERPVVTISAKPKVEVECGA